MTKKSGLFALVTAALLFSGCGGGGHKESITDQIKKRDAVLIIHSTKESTCSFIADTFKGAKEAKDVIFDSPSNTVSCTTYGKTKGDIDDDNAECVETTLVDFMESEDISMYEDDTKACVIGVNRAY